MKPKLYALKTTDTGEWVNLSPQNTFYTDTRPYLYNKEQWTDSHWKMLLEDATFETKHPCRWVEVQVIEAKPVTDEVIESLVTTNEVIEQKIPFKYSDTYEQKVARGAWRVGVKDGFRIACEYFGIPIEPMTGCNGGKEEN